MGLRELQRANAPAFTDIEQFTLEMNQAAAIVAALRRRLRAVDAAGATPAQRGALNRAWRRVQRAVDL